MDYGGLDGNGLWWVIWVGWECIIVGWMGVDYGGLDGRGLW